MKNLKLEYKKPRDLTARVWANRPKRQIFHDSRDARGGAGNQEWFDEDWGEDEPMQFRASGKSGGFFLPWAWKTPELLDMKRAGRPKAPGLSHSTMSFHAATAWS